MTQARFLDTILWATALATAIASAGLWATAGPALLVAATSAAMLACCRAWCRKLSAQAIAGAPRAADRAQPGHDAKDAGNAARWQAIVATATEGIVTIDATGCIETINGAAERLFGYTAAEALGQNVAMLMPQPFRGEHDGYLRRYLATGERRIIGIGREVIGRRKDGSEFPIDLSVGEGNVGGRRFFTAVIRDISERKAMQTKLAHAERLAAVGELAAGVAHEINNPINTVINCAQLIQDGDDLASNCLVINEEGRRIAEIVSALLQFARDDQDVAQPTSLAEVVERTLRLIGENWKRHGVALQVDVPSELPPVHARPQRVQQVLLNLLINAKDALLSGERDARTVWLSAQVDGAGVALTVRDNGPGIPAQLGERIFEPFVTTKRARGGTGLGLSISRSIVEGYGGTIQVTSVPSAGATFRVWLPQAPAE